MSRIADIALAPSGEIKINWVERNMPVLRALGEDFKKTKPFAGLRVALSVHLEAKTAYLCRVLEMGGAEMYVTGSNPLSTQDDVAAALCAGGMNVFARYGCSMEEYEQCLCSVLEAAPQIIIDDGGDLVHLMHTKYTDLIPQVIGGCEETTTGIHRLKIMAREGTLRFPMMMVNEADCKHMFDNRYGTGQSVWDGIMRTTNLVVAGKYVVVSGYGWCGKGVSLRAKGLGAKVIVTETDPIRALEAVMDGYEVMPMAEAAALGDIFITVTGCSGVIRKEHFLSLKDGAILSNAGHFDVEVDMAGLEKLEEWRPERDLPEEQAADYERYFTKLAVYFLFRYAIDAYADGGMLPELVMLRRSLRMIHLMCAARAVRQQGTFTMEDMIDIAHIYSRQTEHSLENVELVKNLGQ